ncbi:YggT family protein [Ruania halotolerans]|uniref:YggT family protein n=1 Tax=Ruania halotolerans TaxID=2897773 RepID=UPI001E4C8679|nr:YggT family protein [Ruania halotolerans]UFU05115.1 YggT family protein [Ruania halotolerans]
MGWIFGLLYLVVLLYLVALLVRMGFDWVTYFARDWKPRGLALIVAEIVYTPTDPPLKALRRLIPPLRLGGIALDVGFLIVLVACWILLGVLARLATM